MTWPVKLWVISLVIELLHLSVTSAQNQQVDRDPQTVSKGQNADLEAENIRMLHSGFKDWETYKSENPRFEIKYPDGLNLLVDENGQLTVSHSIPFEHGNPCDFDDEPSPSLKDLTDFHIELRVLPSDLKAAVTFWQGPLYQDPFTNDSLKIMPGYIDRVSIRSLKGSSITLGAEGCGYSTYYFPLNNSNTLAVRRRYITELNPVISDYRMYRQLPGVLMPDEEEHLFKRMISTFRFLE